MKTALPVIEPISRHPRYQALVEQRNQCTNRKATNATRRSDIEKRLATRQPEDPLAVLRNERPANVAGLRQELEDLDADDARLDIAMRTTDGQLADLAGEITAVVAAPVIAWLADEAAEHLAWLRDGAARAERISKGLDLLPSAGLLNPGLQTPVSPTLDFPTQIREADRDTAHLAARVRRLAPISKAA